MLTTELKPFLQIFGDAASDPEREMMRTSPMKWTVNVTHLVKPGIACIPDVVLLSSGHPRKYSKPRVYNEVVSDDP